ncbi:hypothetical protein AC1031_001442 [Aphanomyces cochlioides]|nr:hypothetical protein AC1031_001442 [Aphanomyces cochlioides]
MAVHKTKEEQVHFMVSLHSRCQSWKKWRYAYHRQRRKAATCAAVKELEGYLNSSPQMKMTMTTIVQRWTCVATLQWFERWMLVHNDKTARRSKTAKALWHWNHRLHRQHFDAWTEFVKMSRLNRLASAHWLRLQQVTLVITCRS